jgi:hypothetical protein
MTGHGIVGIWRLLRWEAAADDGSVLHPMGERPEGVVVYTADGTMITTVGEAGRQPITGGDLLGGPAEERLAAMRSFIAYSGSYVLDGGDVVHTVTMSLFPNWVGTQQRRHVELSADGRVLVLSTDPIVVRGRMGVQRLTWERVGSQ